VKAAVVGDRGVAVRDVPRPAPAPNEVLIRVHASSLNRADLIVASGQPHGKLFGTGSRLGLECAGEVEAVGSEVADLKAGDRVMASAPGGFAEYAVTDWGRVHRIRRHWRPPATITRQIGWTVAALILARAFAAQRVSAGSEWQTRSRRHRRTGT
jgi:NADPH:quinone reductase-like Zn-dependent oxidoreductase